MGLTMASTLYDCFEDEIKSPRSPQWLLHKNLLKGSCGHYYSIGICIQLSLIVTIDHRFATETLDMWLVKTERHWKCKIQTGSQRLYGKQRR